MTDEQAAWLHAQIDEDERTALRVPEKDRTWALDGTIHAGNPPDDVVDWVYIDGAAEHMALNDPSRTLREVAFKRTILDIHRRRADVYPDSAGWSSDNCCHGCGYEGDCDDPVVANVNDCPERRALAAVYDDRPGYQEMWGEQ
ncbi:DUF6221 family protein [Micromonospora haikouensis]|uniref:DUF6221 family protein n=1 Tax=Micromonospora haikouensis TaxID=686309 RepID=UPI0036C777E2